MHKQAALNTVKLFTISIACAIALVLGMTYMSMSMFLTLLAISATTYFGYTFYQMEKSRLESIEKIKSLNEMKAKYD